jgi:hypothetical protein
MRFLLDENVSYRVAYRLKAAGHDAAHVSEMGLTCTNDLVILAGARDEEPGAGLGRSRFVQMIFASGATRPLLVPVREVAAMPSAELAARAGGCVPVAACCCRGGDVEEPADLGPGEFLVAGVVDGLGQELFGLRDEAGEGMQPDAGVAEPVGVRCRARFSVASLRTSRLSWPVRGHARRATARRAAGPGHPPKRRSASSADPVAGLG